MTNGDSRAVNKITNVRRATQVGVCIAIYQALRVISSLLSPFSRAQQGHELGEEAGKRVCTTVMT